MKDNFSRQSDLYAKYRPDYPAELFDYMLRYVNEKALAWDCGTGNGQSALSLSKYFKKVVATDISQKQLDHAAQAHNIEYRLEPAEQTSLPNGSADLITVAQAIHWFRFDHFYKEVRRVAKPGALIAVWTYSLLRISDAIDAIVDEYHFNTLGNYWDPERRYVDEGYANIPFPFEQIPSPVFTIERCWTPEDLEGYFNTWSALPKFISANGYNPIQEQMEKIRKEWGQEAKRKITFPVYLKLGRVE